MSEVVRQADVLSVFCPLTPATYRIIDQEHLNMMNDRKRESARMAEAIRYALQSARRPA